MEHAGEFTKYYGHGRELELGDLVIEDDQRPDLLSSYLADVWEDDDGHLYLSFRDSDFQEPINHTATYVFFRPNGKHHPTMLTARDAVRTHLTRRGTHMSYEPITDEENEKFQAFANAIEQNGAGVAGSLALMRAQLDDEDVAMVVYLHVTEDDEWDAHPLAILVTDELFERLTPPPEVAEYAISGEHS